jgi:stage II sporulation protein R
MKLKIRAVLCLAAVLLLTVLCYEASAEQGGILRLHVIANSDSPEDQRVKLLVRDAILEYERSGLVSCQDSEQARAELMRNGSGILSAAEKVLRDEGMDYGVQLEMGAYEFPRREYDGVVFPEGNYDAMRVVLGDGNGKNWWCVMFPPLCVIDAGDPDQREALEKYKKTGSVEFESLIAKLIDYIKQNKKAEFKAAAEKLCEILRERGFVL